MYLLIAVASLVLPIPNSPCNLVFCSGGECSTAEASCGHYGCACVGGFEVGTGRAATRCCCSDWGQIIQSTCRDGVRDSILNPRPDPEPDPDPDPLDPLTLRLDPNRELAVQIGGEGVELGVISRKFARMTGMKLRLTGRAATARVPAGKYQGSLEMVFQSVAWSAGATAHVSRGAKAVVIDQ